MVCPHLPRESYIYATAESQSKAAKGKQPAKEDLPIRNTDPSGPTSGGQAGGHTNASDSTAASKSSNAARDPFPYRLEVLYNPGPRRPNPVQIIFVHGLNGSKINTWATSGSEFWPEWLPLEAGLENVRIATFGYNSTSNVLKPNSNLSIPDFANQLLVYLSQLNYRDGSVRVLFYSSDSRQRLFSLHTAWVGWWSSKYGNLETCADQKAIIEAYNNPEYASLSRDIAGVLFFGTPHQGSDLAGILNLVLNVSFASRNFVKQLRPKSDALEAINNNFRHRVEEMKLISFFETENTRLQKVIFVLISFTV
jgi:hypothetical protein